MERDSASWGAAATAALALAPLGGEPSAQKDPRACQPGQLLPFSAAGGGEGQLEHEKGQEGFRSLP